ncbi:MAG: glycosyltransferase family 39 protein [Chloroflexi bacterium]|nr:glycosyltransferase family 39 protein [Chloroflexota bacterium]
MLGDHLGDSQRVGRRATEVLVPRSPGAVAGFEEIRAVSLPMIIGLVVRAIPILAAGFPLNDGGLFYAMAEDVRRAGFALPMYSSYNGVGIPFVYPPLAFYLAAALAQFAGMSMIAILMLVPFVGSVLTIGAVYLLAREILPSRFEALLATYAFAVLPRAFDWMIDGGGLTRSPGYLLAVLAIWQAARFYRTRSRGSALATGILAGLTMLTHPEGALFGIVSVVVIFVFVGRNWRSLLASLGMFALAAIVAAPWWAVALLRFGPGPLLSGGQTGLDAHDSFQYVLTWTFTDEPYMAFLAAIGLLGALYCASHRRWLLPVWVVAIFVIDPRGGPQYSMVPLAMLVAIGIREVILATIQPSTDPHAEPLWPRSVVRDRFGGLVLAAALLLGVVAALKVPITPYDPLHALSPANREAMAWVAHRTPVDAQFAVVTGYGWWVDATSEWFPVLADRRSVATVQGWEWMGHQAWIQRVARDDALQSCATSTDACLRSWVGTGAAGLYVYVPKGPLLGEASTSNDGTIALRSSLGQAPGVRLVYDGPGASVYQLTAR